MESFKNLYSAIFFMLLGCAGIALAPAALYAESLTSGFDVVLNNVNSFMVTALFFKILGIPFIVLLLVSGATFFTLKFRFINIRFFQYALSILFGKYGKNSAEGSITHFQAFATAISGTIGLGTVAGVAVAISLGGPGAVPWMALAGFLGMSSKFAEVTLAFKYRASRECGEIFSGPFQYIRYGLQEAGLKKTGIVIAVVYAIFLMLSSVFGAIPFQANQTIALAMGHFQWLDENIWMLALGLCFVIGLVVIGGIKRIAVISSSLMPTMTIIYFVCCLVIIAVNIENLGNAIKIIFDGMMNGSAVGGGAVGAFIAGVRRAAFANEAGMGTSAIAHAGTKDTEPVRAGLVAMLEPCFDTIIICFLTGIIIVITGAYQSEQTGVLMTSLAFESVSWWFTIFLRIVTPLFAFSTIITYCYYCEIAWLYLFNKKTLNFFRVFILVCIYFASISKEIISIASIGDTLFMCSAVINMVALLFLSDKVAQEVKMYLNKNDDISS